MSKRANEPVCASQLIVITPGSINQKLFVDRFRILISDRTDPHKRLHMTFRAPEPNTAPGNHILQT